MSNHRAAPCSLLLSLLLIAIGAMPARADPSLRSAEPLPQKALNIIANRYSSTPELKSAAIVFARATVLEWRKAAATNTYDGRLSSVAASAQMCLSARAARLGVGLSQAELVDFLAALSSTRELMNAQDVAERLQDGHPLSVSVREEDACVEEAHL